MIRYALRCAAGHEFEAWFRNSDTYDTQACGGLVECPVCGGTQVSKAVMAPSIASRKDHRAASQTMMMELAGKVRAHIRDKFDYVGDRFASEARAMHEGSKPHRDIYGETTPQEAEALKDDGVPCAPLPPALTPVPEKKLN